MDNDGFETVFYTSSKCFRDHGGVFSHTSYAFFYVYGDDNGHFGTVFNTLSETACSYVKAKRNTTVVRTVV